MHADDSQARRPPGPPARRPRNGGPVEEIRPVDCFYYLISRATLVASSVLRRRLAAVAGERVKPAYLGVLMTLWNRDGLGALELGREAGLEPSSMTGLLDRMQRDNLIVREPDPDDRRVQRIRLTPEARRLRRAVLDVVDSTLAMASEGFSEEQLSLAKDVLRGFLGNMQQSRRGSDE